jgi:hypothetical protein
VNAWQDHSNESDSDTEGVLSDVHIRIRPPESTSEPGRYISRFPLMLSNPAGEERTNNIEGSDIALMCVVVQS